MWVSKSEEIWNAERGAAISLHFLFPNVSITKTKQKEAGGIVE